MATPKVSRTVLELQQIRGAITALTATVDSVRGGLGELTAEVRTLTLAIRQVVETVKDHDTRLTRLEGQVP